MDQLSDIVETEDGSLTLIHPGHGEAYHSFAGAAREARDLYIGASRIGGSFAGAASVCVLDVGLGLGYNAKATMEAWREAEAPPDLTICSLENQEDLVAELASGQARWQRNWRDDELAIYRSLDQHTPNSYLTQISHPGGAAVLNWEVLVGDALEIALPRGIDFIWQDPFSPRKNPSMWDRGWFAKLGQHANPNCELLTYSVSRTVKDALANAGWDYRIIPTTTSKRNWLVARPSNAI